MNIANRTARRYITPPIKNQPGNARPTSRKHSNVPTASQSPPKKIAEKPIARPQDSSTLKKLIDRFRYEEPQPRPERDSINSDFWWLHDELKTNCTDIDDSNEERKSNIPEFIEIFPSTDIDQDLNKRASLLLNQTFSAHSSDIDNVSSTGVGSIPSTTLTTTTTTATFQPIVPEKPARPLFTRNMDSHYNFVNDGGDDDILYQWRLRRRLEQAQNNEPITFPTKIISRTNISPARTLIPSMPIDISTVLPPRPSSPVNSKPLSPKRERHQSATAIIQTEPIKEPVPISMRTRQYSEAATQTIQDACIQTSLTIENHLSEPTIVANELDLLPTRDNDHQSSIWHRPPSKSKSEIPQALISSSSSSSPTKRHHHYHHRRHHHAFRPVVATEQPTTIDNLHHQKSIINSSSIVQSSQDSTLTQVTSIMIRDNNNDNNNNDVDNHCPMKNNDSIATIDDFHQQQQDDNNNNNNNNNEHIDYSNDEILNILVKKRDELLVAFRDIEQRLTNMKSE